MTDVQDEEDAFDAKVKAEADQRIGQTVGGKYKIIRALGVGGMGAVYEVEHELIGKRQALKCLHPEYARDRDLIERFKREARAATAIGNEHIVDVTDMGDLPDGAPFIVMEMLKGQALADLMDKEGVLPVGRSCRIVRQICFALAAAHEKGIVHRDMKPENVFLAKRSEEGDFVKVLDFGISKMHEHGKTDRGLTRTGIAMGTPSYMSPEQAQGAKDVDLRTDIWAVGVMLYEMLTLRRPFEAESYPMMLMAIVGRDPEPVRAHRKDVPEELDQIILRTLIKPVGLRTQTMRELAEQLLPFVGIDGSAQMTGFTGRNSLADARPSQTRAMKKSSPESDPPPAEIAIDGDGERIGTAGTVAAGESVRPPGRQATPVTRAGETPLRSEPPPASERAQKTGVLGSTERKNQPTGEIGTIEISGERRGREATSSGTAVPMQGNRTGMFVGLALVVIAGLAIGAYATSGGGGPVTEPVETAAADPATPPVVPTPPPEPPPEPVGAVSVPVAPTPAEVEIQITTSPADAHIAIGGVEFPNPMMAHRPRSLDPVTITISAPGHQTVERLAIFDHDQSFVFQLSRGRGVRREGMDGSPRTGPTTDGHVTPETTTPHEDPPPDETGGFRDDF